MNFSNSSVIGMNCERKSDMESFMLAAEVVVPLIVYMATGGLIRKLNIMSRDNFRAVNVLVFRVFLPLTLFFNVYDVDLESAVRPDVFALVLVGILAVFAAAWLVTDRWVENRADGSSVIQGIYRSNFVLFGSSIALSLCDAKGQALLSALAALAVPMFNVLAVILFETRRGGGVKPRSIVLNILKNPLVDAGILGCIFNLSGLRLPELLEEPLVSMAGIATPLALVTLGGLLSFGSIVSHRKYLTVAVLARLVFVPFVMLTAFALAGYRGDALVAVLAVFGSPTAVASAPMAQAMGGNGSLAGEIVAVTSVCCIVTIFLFVYVLSFTGLI